MATQAQRYTAVAIVLHWAIAVAILFMIPMGLWMHESAEHGDVSAQLFRAYQLHKSIGLTVLALSLVRLGWRLMNPPPPLPEHMPGWERLIAKATHWAFYALMIGLPLSGWLYVSAGWSIHDDAPLPVATQWFGLFRVPSLFGLNQADLGVREDTAETALTAHAYLAYATLGLAALHVLAALKHHLFDKDEVLAHMAPGLRAPFDKEPAPKNPVRLAVLGVGLSSVLVCLAGASFALLGGGGGPSSPLPQPTFEVVQPNTAQTPPTQTEAPATSVAATTTTPGQPAAWRVNASQSSIGFAFSLDDGSGNPSRIDGRFARWSADIRFDPAALDNSAVSVTIDTGSASTGVPTQDAAMRDPAWFGTTNTNATFRANEFRRRGESYEARGELTIKGRERDVRLPFTLIINGNTAVMNGAVSIDREDFDLGKDAEGSDMISRNVDVTIRVQATRAP
jgi:cytochrome b561